MISMVIYSNNAVQSSQQPTAEAKTTTRGSQVNRLRKLKKQHAETEATAYESLSNRAQRLNTEATAHGGRNNRTRQPKQPHAEAEATICRVKSNLTQRPKQPRVEATAITHGGKSIRLKTPSNRARRPKQPSTEASATTLEVQSNRTMVFIRTTTEIL